MKNLQAPGRMKTHQLPLNVAGGNRLNAQREVENNYSLIT
jgi:hypothetical protein